MHNTFKFGGRSELVTTRAYSASTACVSHCWPLGKGGVSFTVIVNTHTLVCVCVFVCIVVSDYDTLPCVRVYYISRYRKSI
jgi:hypothetical protein